MNINKQLKKINEYFAPKVIGEVNDVYIKIAKIKGDELPWHNHKKEDEFFFILEGNLLLEVEGQEKREMKEGDYYVVRRGTNHKVSAKEECKIMLIENKSTAHTGEIKTGITKSLEDQLK